MGLLVTVKGPHPGRQFALQPGATVLGRQTDSHICLESRAVSRHHARILCQNGDYFIEDLGSSNGTYLNGKRIAGRVPITDKDTLQVGPYVFVLHPSPADSPSDTDLVIREQVSVSSSNWRLFDQDPAQKLQVVMEISQHLARTLDIDTLLGRLLDHLMRLFPQADRSMVLLYEEDQLVIRAQRARGSEESAHPYSKTIVNQALKEGIGILSEDVRSDQRFSTSTTLRSLDLRSLLCVPLICQDGRRLGVIQMDRVRGGSTFRREDLQMLTAVCLQVAVVLENAALHAEVLREERLRQELTMAREIQQGYLPSEFPEPAVAGYELFASVTPARQVSGDLYDFLPRGDGRLAFLVGDVSGKGMPAALFMVAVRTLARHLAVESDSPAAVLERLNAALSQDNPSCMFATVAYGLYTPASGELVLASGGHPPPLLRRPDGHIAPLELKTGRLLGCDAGDLHLSDSRFTLQPGDTLILYTDGYTEARAANSKEMFGLRRLQEALSGARTIMPLETCADAVKTELEQFVKPAELQDDLTMLLLRRAVALR